MAFCKQYENLLLEAADTDDQGTKLTVALEEVQCASNVMSSSKLPHQRRSDSEFYVPQMPGGMPVAPSVTRSSSQLVLSLTHGEGNLVETDPSRTCLVAFTTTLPATLFQIAEQCRGSSLGEGLKVEEKPIAVVS